MKKFLFSLRLVSFALLGAVAMAAPGTGYHLIKKISLAAAPGGGEYFDYVTVDSAARSVYLSHGGEVKVLDLKSLNKTAEINTPPDTDSIFYDPASKLIFTFNGDSKNASVIDPVKETVVKTIDLDGGVEQAVADGKGTIYDNNEEKNDVAAIDTKTLTVKARWPVAPAGSPVAMDMDREHRRLFSSGRDPSFLVMMDADSGKVLQSLPISSGVDANVFEPETGWLFVSTRAGKLHIFHEDSPNKLTEVETITTEYGAKTMNLDSKTHNLFLSTSDFGPPGPPTKKHPKPERTAIPGTFHVLVYGR